MRGTVAIDRPRQYGHRTTRYAIAGLALAVLLSGVPATAGAEEPSDALKIAGPTRFSLDPVCNARTGAALVSMLRNTGSTPVSLPPGAGEPVSKTAGKTATKVTITPLDASSRPSDKATLAPGELIGVRVDLKGTLNTGDWEIEVLNAGARVGSFTVVTPPAPFGVKLDVATPDQPELAFERGRPATIGLKNDDDIGYEVSGQYSVRGVVKEAERPIFLSAKGGGELRLIPPPEWFTPVLRTLFKDDVADGRLTIRFASANCPNDAATPARVFKAKTTLTAWPTAARDFRGNLILLGTLFLGGICSLALNFFLPAHGRRRSARTQLSLIVRQIDDLPVQGDPRIRASIAVERRQLAERLRRLKFYDMQFAGEMTELEHGLARLSTRLALLGEMELVLNRYWRQRSVIVSDDIEELRRQLTDLLRRSDPGDTDIEAGRALIKKIGELLANATAVNPDLAGRLAKRVSELKKEFDATQGPLGTSPVWTSLSADLAEDFAEVVGPSALSDAANITPDDYVRLAKRVFILNQVSAFIKLCGAVGPSGTLSVAQKALRDRLMLNLRGGAWEQLYKAERLIRQMREGISYTEIEDHIQQKRVAIEPNRIVVRQFEPTELRVVFLDKGLQRSAAREEYTPHWTFEYANLHTTGWSVSHFFPLPTDPEAQPSEPELGRIKSAWRALRGSATVAETRGGTTPQDSGNPPQVFSKPYNISVTFVRDDGIQVPGAATTEIRVRPPLAVKVRASFWMELLRLSLALGIAAIGLIAGAREQLLKLDVFPALIAVFLLGFGSDRIKNLFSQRAEGNKPTGNSTP